MSPLRFPAVARPEVSVVMVAYGGLAWTGRALQALLDHTGPVFELIVVDNPAGDGTAELLAREAEGATLLLNRTNVGFSAACNQGAAHARGRHLAFLNNDLFVHAGWLPPLLGALESEGVGAAGPRFLNLDGSLQEAGALLSRSGVPLDYGSGDEPGRPAYRFPRTVDYLAGACLLVRRSAFCAVGGFDAVFGLGYYEDADLCLRLAAAGYRTVYEPRSVVTHVRGGSGAAGSLQTLVLRNQSLFEERWRPLLASRPLPPLAGNPRRMLAARDAPAEARFLVLSPENPGPGSPASVLIDRLRSEHPRAQITLAAVGEAGGGPEAERLLGLGVEVEVRAEGWSPWLLARRFHYDAVYGSVPALDGLVCRTQPQAFWW
ncbi:MAG TPA: glycosyltransferase family 2 protein [Thermoanaerobaculia bacterium]|nr:glycosyltransferase family 2 protein [Thermoanaerobaculia bacterium]